MVEERKGALFCRYNGNWSNMVMHNQIQGRESNVSAGRREKERKEWCLEK